MNLPIQEKDGILWIGKVSDEKVNSKIVVNGKPFLNAFESKPKEWMVELKPFVEASGHKFIMNEQTKIIDILPAQSEVLTQKEAVAMSNVVSEPATDYLTYTSRKNKLSIKYPSSWNKLEGIQGTIIAFRRPKENNSEKFLENLNIVIEELSEKDKKATLDQYFKAGLAALKEIFPTLEVVSSFDTTLANNPARRNLYNYSVSGLHLKLMQMFMIVNAKVYIISYTASEENYEKYLPTINAMIDSFKLE